MKKILCLLVLVCHMVCANNGNGEGSENLRPGQYPMPDQSANVSQLQPVFYSSENAGLDLKSTYQTYPGLVANDGQGNYYGVNYSGLVAILVQVVQNLIRRVQNLENQIGNQNQQN